MKFYKNLFFIFIFLFSTAILASAENNTEWNYINLISDENSRFKLPQGTPSLGDWLDVFDNVSVSEGGGKTFAQWNTNTGLIYGELGRIILSVDNIPEHDSVYFGAWYLTKNKLDNEFTIEVLGCNYGYSCQFVFAPINDRTFGSWKQSSVLMYTLEESYDRYEIWISCWGSGEEEDCKVTDILFGVQLGNATPTPIPTSQPTSTPVWIHPCHRNNPPEWCP